LFPANEPSRSRPAADGSVAVPFTRRGVRNAFGRAWPALLLALALCLPWLSSPMFLDDWHLLWKASQAPWTWEGLTRAFTFLDASSIGSWNLPEAPPYHFFRPLVVALLKLEWLAWGDLPAGFHAVSLALHLASTVLVGALAARVTGRERVGRLAAVLFAGQPHAVASVLWTSGLTEALGAALVLAALYAYVVARQDRKAGWLLASVLLAAVACLAKENAVLIGLCAVAWETSLLVSNPRRWRERLRAAVPALAPLVVVLGSFAAYRLLAFDTGGVLYEPYYIAPSSDGFAYFAISKLVYYLASLVTTVPIVPIFGDAFLRQHPVLLAGVAALVLAFFYWVSRAAWGRGLAPLAWAWMAVAFLPTMSILASDLYPYLAGVGFALLVAGALAEQRRATRWLVAGLLGLYALGFTARAAIYHAQGVQEDTAALDVERELGGAVPDGARLLLVNLPVSVGHLASHLRLRSGHADVHASLVTLSPEWTVPTQAPRVECRGPRSLRVGPPPGREALLDTPEEWEIQLFRTPLVEGRSFQARQGFRVTPVWGGGRVRALDLDLDQPLGAGPAHVMSFHQDAAGRLAHQECEQP
jgi:hypothetical protein